MKFLKNWIKEKEKIVNKIHKLNEHLSSKESKDSFDEFEINKMLYKLSTMEDCYNILDDLIYNRKNYRKKINCLTEDKNEKNK